MNLSLFQKLSFLFVAGLFYLPISSPAEAAAVDAEEEIDRSNVYVVKKGDTLNSIGRKFGVNARDISSRNDIADPNKIHVGQVLIIPRGNEIGLNPLPKKSPPVVSKKNQMAFEEEFSPAPPARKSSTPTFTPKLTVEGEEAQELEEEVIEKKEKDPHRHFIGASMTGWFAFIEEAEVRVNEGPIRGTGVELTDALDVDEEVAIPVVNAWVEPFPWLKLEGEYMEFNVDGSRRIDETITFEGFTFGIQDTVEGELDVQRASGWLELNLIRGKWGYIGGMVGGEYAHVEAELSSNLVGSVKEKADAGTVSLGGQARIYITDEWEFGGRLRTFSYEISDIEFSFVDFQVDTSYTLFNFIELSAGYRALFLEVENDEATGNLELHGPFISGGIKI